MPVFLNIVKHTPETCPVTHEGPRKIALELVEKTEALTKKHGVKVLGVWSVHNEQQECMHETYSLYDTPSLEAYEKLSLEPEFVAWYNIHAVENKVVLDVPDTIKLLTQAK